jgi:hypothetical protein
MVNVRDARGNTYGAFISPAGWRILAEGSAPGNLPFALRPEGASVSTVSCPIRPISRIRPILPNPKSTFPHRKSTVDLGYEPLIRVKNGLRSTPSRTDYRPISGPKIKGFNQTQTVTDQKNSITDCYVACLPARTAAAPNLRSSAENHPSSENSEEPKTIHL